MKISSEVGLRHEDMLAMCINKVKVLLLYSNAYNYLDICMTEQIQRDFWECKRRNELRDYERMNAKENVHLFL